MASHPSSKLTSPGSTPPSSSSVDRPAEIKYDVFVSFRGPDVRSSFLSHLLQALDREKFVYFVDDHNLQPGDKISSTLLDAIKKSEISLVLFSEDYASSPWCLGELEEIIESMENHNQIVVPIFYKVDPSTVRHQKEKYENAFHKLSERFDDNKLQKWKAALKRASDLSGFDLSNYNTEATFINKIVERVKELKETRSQNEDVLESFVGIRKHIQYLETQLETKSTIGIWGMGGLGKTTIAEILYNKLHDKYEGSHLLYVKQELEKGKFIIELKKDLLSKLSGQKIDDVTLSDIPKHVKRILFRKRVLIILDDVDDWDQQENLIPRHVELGTDSRIIMTSRNKQALRNCDEIYPVEGLNPEDALQLFEKCLEMAKNGEKCLQKSSAKKQELLMLSKRVVDYAKGVPLVIKILGHDLSTVESKLEWESKLEKLKKIPDQKIQKVLEISYDGMEDEHKDIFLYIACFFRYELKERIIMILDACGYHTIEGLRILQDKALITISNERFVSMHDLIQAMGYEIVRKKSPNDLNHRSHLWDANDTIKVRMKPQGTQTIEAIFLSRSSGCELKPQAFARLNNLKLLQFEPNVYPPKEGFESLPKELRSISWKDYPLKSFPLRCRVDKLVELCFRSSNLERLWDGIQELPSLKVINLSLSERLIELPDLSKAPKIESVILFGCKRLRRVPLWPRSSPPYVLPSLQNLDLRLCGGISELPSNIGLLLPSLHSLDIGFTNVKALPESIRHLAKLTLLDVSGCKLLENIPELPPSIERLTAYLCSSLKEVQFSSNLMHLSHQMNELNIMLGDCDQLGKPTLEKIAVYYKRSTQKMMSTGTENTGAFLSFPGSQVPACFKNCCITRGLVLDPPLNLPLHSEAMGFIFCFFIEGIALHFEAKIKCHIELSNVAKVQFICGSLYFSQYPIYPEKHGLLLYKGCLSLKIVEELSRIKASATTNDMHIKVWFDLLEDESDGPEVKEWGVYCITSSEP